MKTFMEVCKNWGADGCRPGISKWKLIEESEYKEGIQLYPLKEKVDKICMDCSELSLKECPDCGSQDIAKMIGFKPKIGKKIVGSIYACRNCDFIFTKTRSI